MAFWQRKSNGRIFVYFWDRDTGSQRTVPRDLTRHLDRSLTDEEIDAWVEVFSAKQALELKPMPGELAKETVELVRRFCSFLDQVKGRHRETIHIHQRNLLVFALPYFEIERQVVRFEDYRKHSRDLGHWLRESCHLPETKVKAVHLSLGLFWKWLVEEDKAQGTIVLRNRSQHAKPTPLQLTPDPESILGWEAPGPELRLILLLAYFFSLRPQEIFALEYTDFVAGDLAAQQEACRVMSQAKLYGRLLVKVQRQRSRGMPQNAPPKAGSAGIVACFHEQAAREIVNLLNGTFNEGPLFNFGLDWYYKLWRRQGYPGLTIKDLRRASLYWLGHYTSLDIVALKNHARHQSIQTTTLYTRRPLYDLVPLGGPLEL